MVEILAGGEFANAVRDLNLVSALCTYQYHPKQESEYEDYQVWALSQDDFDNICSINDDDWKDNWGWWQYATGSNFGSVNHEYIIHDKRLIAWDGYERIDWREECATCCTEQKRGLCEGAEEDFNRCFGGREYPDIITYLRNEVEASTKKNICACTIDLARQNSMTLSELFKKYLGEG